MESRILDHTTWWRRVSSALPNLVERALDLSKCFEFLQLIGVEGRRVIYTHFSFSLNLVDIVVESPKFISL